MLYIPTNEKISLEWSVKKGVGNEAEDFSRATVSLFLFSDENRWAVPCTADYTGVVRAEIPETLPEGVYSLDLLWIKNEDSIQGTRCVQRTRKTHVFAIDSAAPPMSTRALPDLSVIPNPGQPVTLRMTTVAAPYGYDGLSAYEAAILYGMQINISEKEWAEILYNYEASEASRVEAENIRRANEAERIANEDVRMEMEDARETNEDERKTEEAERLQSEAARNLAESTRNAQETLRETVERNRAQAEQVREANEVTRETNESKRIEQEETRQENEATRQKQEGAKDSKDQESRWGIFNNAEAERAQTFRDNEDGRIVEFEGNEAQRIATAQVSEVQRENRFNDAEALRQTNETTRVSNEAQRQNDEALRQSNEALRQSNEALREENEIAREAAEAVRQQSYLDKMPTSAIVQEAGDSEDHVMSQKATTEKLLEVQSGAYNYALLRNKVVDIEDGNTYGSLVNSAYFDTVVINVADANIVEVAIKGAVVSRYNWYSRYGFSPDCYLGNNATGAKKGNSRFVLISLKHSENPNGYSDMEVQVKKNFTPAIADRNCRILYNVVQSYDKGAYTFSTNTSYDLLLISLLDNVSSVKIEGVAVSDKGFNYSSSEPSVEGFLSYGGVKKHAKTYGVNIRKSNNEGVDYSKITVTQVMDYVPADRFENIFGKYIVEKPKGKNYINKDDLLEGYIISGGTVIESGTGALSNKLFLEAGKKYTVQGVVAYGATPNIYFAAYDRNDNFIERFGVVATLDSVETEKVGHATFTMEVDCHYVRVCVKNKGTTDPSIVQLEEGSVMTSYEPYQGKKETLDIQAEAQKKHVKLLCIGNSYSQDALAYVPFILKEINPNIDVTIGILYLSGARLSQHYNNYINNSASYIYYKYSAGHTSWATVSSASTIQNGLNDEAWDIVLLHQGSTASVDWVTYQPYLNRLIDLIYNDVKSPIKFGWMLTQSRPKSTDYEYSDSQIADNYNSIAANAKRVMEETLCEFIVPVGTAVQNARTTSLNGIGDYGKLCSSDGGHLQEGLPSQLAAYVCILKLLEIAGESQNSIFGDSTRVTDAWVADKSIPGGNGTPVGSDDYNCGIAQKCAIMAVKHPCQITQMVELGIVAE